MCVGVGGSIFVHEPGLLCSINLLIIAEIAIVDNMAFGVFLVEKSLKKPKCERSQHNIENACKAFLETVKIAL